MVKYFFKFFLHKIIIPVSLHDNYVSFLINLFLFCYYHNYNPLQHCNAYVYTALESSNYKKIQNLLRGIFKKINQDLILDYVKIFGLKKQFNDIETLFERDIYKFLSLKLFFSYLDEERGGNNRIVKNNEELSIFYKNLYNYDNKNFVYIKNDKPRILYITSFFSQDNLFALFDCIARKHNHDIFSYYIFITSSVKNHLWIDKYKALGYKFLTYEDLKDSTFDIVLDWDGFFAFSDCPVLYKLGHRIAPVYISFGNDFLPGGLHDYYITYDSIAQQIYDVEPKYFLSIADKCILSMVLPSVLSNINCKNQYSYKELNNSFAIVSHVNKFSDKDIKLISNQLSKYPDRELFLINHCYQFKSVQNIMRDKFYSFGVSSNRLKFLKDETPEYLYLLKKMQFFFLPTYTPGGRVLMETLANGILAPYFKHTNNIYSLFGCLIPKVLGLDWLVAHNEQDYDNICQKLINLTNQDRRDISLQIRKTLANHQRNHEFDTSQEFENLYKNLT